MSACHEYARSTQAQRTALAGLHSQPKRPPQGGRRNQRACQHAPAAFEGICELIDSNDERIALAASQEILNRAYGRPVQAVGLPSAPSFETRCGAGSSDKTKAAYWDEEH